MSISSLISRPEYQRLSALLAVVVIESPALNNQLDELVSRLLLEDCSPHEAQIQVSRWLDQVQEINPELVPNPQDIAWLIQLEYDGIWGKISLILLLVSALQLVSAFQHAAEGKPPFLLISDLARQTHRSDEQWRTVIARSPGRYVALQVRGHAHHARLWLVPQGVAAALRRLSPGRGRKAKKSLL